MNTSALKFFLLTFCFAAVLLGAAGCASTADNENASVRPWNAPKSWETGIPSAMTEGR